MQYHVMFEYTIPQFNEITLDVEDERSRSDVEELAWAIFHDTYPEAIDAELVEVQELGPNG